MAMFNPLLFSENCTSTAIHAKNFLKHYKDLFKWVDSEEVLDIGCANGRITKEILYSFVDKYVRHHLTGADISESAIKFANDTKDNTAIRFQTLDITDIEECDKYIKKFQHIFAFYVFHTIHRPDLWSQNVYKMLKPNGQMFASIVASSPNFFNVCVTAQRADKSKPWFKYIENVPNLFFDYGDNPMETIGNILKRVGFVINVIDTHEITAYFKDYNEIKNTFISANPCIKHIPDEFKDAYIEDYVSKAFEYAKCENGMFTTVFDVVTVLVTKPED